MSKENILVVDDHKLFREGLSALLNAAAETVVIGEAGTGKVDGKYTRVPKQAELDLDTRAAYVHFTTNNTIMGTQFHYVPDTGEAPLVADMSSDMPGAQCSVISRIRPRSVTPSASLSNGCVKTRRPIGSWCC